METKKILVADKIAQKGIAMLEAEAQFEVDVSIGLGEAEICERVVDADAIVVRSATQVTDKVIESGRRLKVIGRAGIGVDNINVQCATERGIVVLNTPDANATTTAELAIAHILSLSRHLPNADASVRAGEWKRAKFVGAEVARKASETPDSFKKGSMLTNGLEGVMITACNAELLSSAIKSVCGRASSRPINLNPSTNGSHLSRTK